MKKSLRHLLSLVLPAALAAMPIQHAFGQDGQQFIDVAIEAPIYDELFSPAFDGVKGKKYDSKPWLEFEAPLFVRMKPEPPSKTCEKLTVTWYVAVESPGKSGGTLLLTKQIDYVNVPLDQQVFVSCYLTPASVSALIGRNSRPTKIVQVVGCEVSYNGKKVQSASSKLKDGWWNSSSLSRTEVVKLRSKPETPFSNCWWDRYAEVDPSKK